MFYEHIILAKKGPLAKIWLAAHWDKKITKAHVFETNIEKSVEGILQPKVKLALRTSGHLLLGVVRIYSRKAKYLLADCNEAFVKIKMAFRPGMVDLPEGHREANVNAITLPEVFHDFDTALPELNDIDIEAQFSINQSRADEITMREDYGSLSLSLQDDGFGDIGFEAETPEIMRGSIASNINEKLFGSNILDNIETLDQQATTDHADISGTRLDGDGFGDSFGQPELFEDDLFGEPAQPVEQLVKDPTAVTNADDSDEDAIDDCNNVPSPATSFINDVEEKETKLYEHANVPNNNKINEITHPQNEDEGFALAPLDATIYRGVTKAKRKRKLIIDEIKNISGEEMKAQLADTSDIITTLDLAPPTKRLMYWKETGGVEKLFSLPSRYIPARSLLTNYNRQLYSHSTLIEDFSSVAPMEILALEYYAKENENAFIIFNKKGRKRKNDILNNQFLDHVADSLTQSLEAPEVLREDQKSLGVSGTSLEIAKEHESCQNESTIFDNMESPDLLSLNEIEQFSSINDLPLTPRNAIHDMGDDYNQDDSTPTGLDHGQTTPQNTHMGEIDDIPIISTDQISAIFNESVEQPLLNDNGVLKRANNISKGWHNHQNYEISTFATQNHSDEQMENETDEQFEERVLNKRAAHLFIDVRAHFVSKDNLTLSHLTSGNSRKQAAQKFYSLLVLKKFKVLHIAQSAPYADISITRGPTFENPKM
ncbi:double-strand-break repair protein rad21 homolog isoform X2 [Drosophila eugracilis]|uniref:double-strand-break repair protein rad21 homolog isoform X2 n=1 Tax=Drosophila eugracilis TaxID=29029 RepID=UPI001BDA8178|nr:double-strand-break repair protein rad21 homolog isoform X2 [Drosophila eugracilis]